MPRVHSPTSLVTRPELTGTFGMVASTHWLATAVGQSVLERGGTAVDAAAATGLALQVVEPHLNGPAGEVPVIVRPAGGPVHVVCGQGTAPARASVDAVVDLGLDHVPGTGLLAATVPGSFGAWALLVQRWGTWSVADVLGPAISLAADGAPVLDRVEATLQRMAGHFREHWGTSAETYLVGDGPDGVPRAGTRLRLPVLAETYRRVVDAAGTGPHEQQWERARAAWYEGFVAEAVDAFCARTSWLDSSGEAHGGFLTGADMAAWHATVEEPATLDLAQHPGVTVCKTGAWGQGPVMLQVLGMLGALGVGTGPLADAEGREDPAWLHAWVEATKLALADREAWFGDSGDDPPPLADLLDPAYLAARAGEIGTHADLGAHGLRPGAPGGRAPVLPTSVTASWADWCAGRAGAAAGAGAGEPTVDRAGVTRGDTVHLDVVDRWGTVVSATPSGAWLQSSPVVPALGFPLGTRGQMFRVEPGLPASLRPGRRPRTTLSPTLVLRDGEPWLALGTPGGDQQDQWTTVSLVRMLAAAAHGRREGERPAALTPLQAVLDEPMLHTDHAPGSFHPRGADPGSLLVEDRTAPHVVDDLRRRGHRVATADGWSLGRTCVVGVEGGFLRAAANARGAQGYAAGR
ncbi:gamma-glutamyltransferase family protein [Aquipuribacter nitratireducens]|uniref:Gamma-glutamyltransferase family protein n=1 Tax=Aquipuribacter nitratireducens TaxID=650104 RepID=A0ABW0GPS1_9MICO